MNHNNSLELLELIDELVSDLSNSEVKLSKSLSRAKKISISLENSDLNEFITNELEGEFDENQFPEYRKCKATTKGIFQNNFNGRTQHQELNYNQFIKQTGIESGDFPDRHIFNSVPEMEDFYETTSTKTLMIEFSQSHLDFVRKYLKEDDDNGWYLKSAYFELSYNTFTKIMAVVRNRLIEKLLKIEMQLKTSERTESGAFFENGTQFKALIDLSNRISQAKKEIILIDGYINENTINQFSSKPKNVKVKILTDKKSINPKLQLFIDAFNKENENLEVKTSSTFHDRFIILDNSTCYSIGASIKDAGNKAFMISKINEPFLIQQLLNQFNIEWNK